MVNNPRFEKRRVRVDEKHGAVRAMISYATIFSAMTLLTSSFLSEETLAQTPSYWAQISGARVEACTVSGCIADPSGVAPLSTGQLQQTTLSRTLTVTSTGAIVSPPASPSASAQFSADITLGTLRASAWATASDGGGPARVFGTASWGDTITVTSGGQFQVTISLSDTITAGGLPAGPCHPGIRAILGLTGLVGLSILDDRCFPPSSRTATATFTATTGQVFSVAESLMVSIDPGVGAPSGATVSVLVDASHTGTFKLDPLTAGATYTTASGRSYLSEVPNQPPVANAGSSQTVSIRQTVSLDGSASMDPDNNTPLTYAWSFFERPAGSTATLSNADTSLASFTPDAVGDFIVQLVVTDSRGAVSAPARVTISTVNSKPVADAGPDQAITLVGTTVQLDGRTSYDPDGDPITYMWTLTQKPEGSTATLSNASGSTPTFVADKNGTYFAMLIVQDSRGAASASDSVTISFDNVKPVADAGGNQAVTLGQTVQLNGSGSSDANGDALGYAWHIVSAPAGSTAALVGATTQTPSFSPDAAGTFVISLIVNDGFLNSDPHTVTVEVTTRQSQAITEVRGAITAINGLSDGSFKNPNLRNALTNKLNAVLHDIDLGLYQDALNKLQNDVLTKTGGCSQVGSPDKNDWVTVCASQNLVVPALQRAIVLLRESL